MEQLLFQRQTDAEPSIVEAPPGLCGFGAGEVHGCPFCADFYSCLLLSVGCSVSVHSQPTEPYVFTLHLPAVPHPASGIHCVPWAPCEWGQKLGVWSCLLAGSGCSAEKSHFVTACETVPTLKGSNWNCGAGDEVLFYRPDLYEEHLGKTQLRDTRL